MSGPNEEITSEILKTLQSIVLNLKKDSDASKQEIKNLKAALALAPNLNDEVRTLQAHIKEIKDKMNTDGAVTSDILSKLEKMAGNLPDPVRQKMIVDNFPEQYTHSRIADVNQEYEAFQVIHNARMKNNETSTFGSAQLPSGFTTELPVNARNLMGAPAGESNPNSLYISAQQERMREHIERHQRNIKAQIESIPHRLEREAKVAAEKDIRKKESLMHDKLSLMVENCKIAVNGEPDPVVKAQKIVELHEARVELAKHKKHINGHCEVDACILNNELALLHAARVAHNEEKNIAEGCADKQDNQSGQSNFAEILALPTPVVNPKIIRDDRLPVGNSIPRIGRQIPVSTDSVSTASSDSDLPDLITLKKHRRPRTAKLEPSQINVSASQQ